ncbi:class E sortase, partial [Streptomyces sp. SID5785]|nr:class E sortase [Streptomyces sp. SID5785]
MTALRPEHDGDAGGFEEAVRRLDDPLSDPLPGQHPSPWFRAPGAAEQEPAPQQHAPQQHAPQESAHRPPAPQPVEPEPEWYDPAGYAQDWYGEQTPVPDDETVALRTADTRRATEPDDGPREPVVPDEEPAPAPVATGGRAARRKAARKGGGRHAGGAT